MTARERLVFSTIDLVRRHGVAGTGVAEILTHGDVSRRSIYLNFPDGKAELVAEATRVAGAFIGAQIAEFVALPGAHEALDAFVEEWRKVLTDSDFAAGCPVTAAALSRSTTSEVADLAGEEFERWQTTIGASLHRHGISEPDAHSLANTIIAAVEGAVIMCVAQRSTTALDNVGSQMSILLDHHLPSQ